MAHQHYLLRTGYIFPPNYVYNISTIIYDTPYSMISYPIDYILAWSL